LTAPSSSAAVTRTVYVPGATSARPLKTHVPGCAPGATVSHAGRAVMTTLTRSVGTSTAATVTGWMVSLYWTVGESGSLITAGAALSTSMTAESVATSPAESVTRISTVRVVGPSRSPARNVGVGPTSSPLTAAAPVSPKTPSPSRSHSIVSGSSTSTPAPMPLSTTPPRSGTAYGPPASAVGGAMAHISLPCCQSSMVKNSFSSMAVRSLG